MLTADSVYGDLLKTTLETGERRGDRTGTGTISKFGGSATFSCVDTVPLLTTKRVAIRSCMAELVWFLIGSNNANLLNQLRSKIWDEWKLEEPHTTGVRLSITERQALLSGKLDTTLEVIQRMCHEEDIKAVNGYPEGTYNLLKRNNIREWEDQVVHPAGYVGPMYGVQWNSVPKGFMKTRLEILLHGLKQRPTARDHILMAWNDDVRPIYDEPSFGDTNAERITTNLKLGRQPIPPCHFASQYYVHTDEYGNPTELSLQFHMRSADLFLGVPFNILSYGVLLHLIAAHLGLTAKNVSVTFGDRHIYSNHIDQVNEQLARTEKEVKPTFKLHPGLPDIRAICNIPHTDIDLLNSVVDMLVDSVSDYEYHPAIQAPISQ